VLKKNWHIILPLFVLIANIIDLVLTLIALNCTDVFREVNPFMLYLFDNYGMLAASIFKMAATGFVCWIIWFVMQQQDRFLKIFLSVSVVGLYGFLLAYWVVCWVLYFLIEGV